MRNGHIATVVFLTAGPDKDLVEQGKRIFAQQADKAFDGFEVWDGTRRLHVHPENPEAPNSN